MKDRLQMLMADGSLAGEAMTRCALPWADFILGSAKGKSLGTHFPPGATIYKKNVRFPVLERIHNGNRQNASCRIKSMGAVGLAINAIAGLTILFGMNLLMASYRSRA